MARITAAALETALNGTDTNRKYFQVIKSEWRTTLLDAFLVQAGVYQTANPAIRHGTTRWCVTTVSGDAAAQATEVITAMAN